MVLVFITQICKKSKNVGSYDNFNTIIQRIHIKVQSFLTPCFLNLFKNNNPGVKKF